VLLAVFAIEGKDNGRSVADGGVNRLKPCLQFLCSHLRGQRKVEILRKAIVAKIAALQRRSAFESERCREVRFRERGQEPGKAVVAFQNALGNPASAFLGNPVGEK